MPLAGKLKVEVEAAADGTGTVVVAPTMVRAAANDVKTRVHLHLDADHPGRRTPVQRSVWVERTPSERCRGSGLHRCRWKRSRNR